MLEPADASHEKVRQCQPGQLAGEDPEPAGTGVRLEVILPVRGACAERDLMIAVHDREVVAQLRGIGQKPARPLILGFERALNAHPHDMRLIAVHVGAEVVGIKGIWREAAHGGAVEREPQRVHRVGTEDARVTDRQRMGERVEPLQPHVARGVEQRQHTIAFPHRARHRRRGRQVAAEDRVVAGALVIDPREILNLVAVLRLRIGDLAARIRRCRQVLDHVQRRPAEQRGIDAVVFEPAPQRNLPAPIAGGRREGGEVAGQHRRRWHPREVGGRLLPHHRSLHGAEEEELVLHDRPADRAAELVALQAVVHAVAVRADLRERVRRVETVIAHELEHVSRQAVRPRLGDCVDCRPGMHSMLRVQAARGHAELL